MFYRFLKNTAGLCFNLLNSLLGGNLPPFTCVCVIIEDNGRYLVIERPTSKYAFPGGFMRWHEHPEQTARRESREETGLNVQIGPVIGYQSRTSTSLTMMSTVNLIYCASVIDGTLRGSMEGNPCWLDKEELSDRLSAIAREAFEQYQRYRAHASL